MAAYNGHKNWNHWNVSLWLTNDEGLYHLLMRGIGLVKYCGKTRDYAAHVLLNELQEFGATHTPDGAPYTFTSVRAALRHIEE